MESDRCSAGVIWIDPQAADGLFERYPHEAVWRRQKAFFNRGITWWDHSGLARKLILSMKYKGDC